jgi:hypothetical protein
MLTFASDFWPLFWTIVGAGAALTVIVTFVVAMLLPEKRHEVPAATLTQLAAAYQPAQHANAA